MIGPKTKESLDMVSLFARMQKSKDNAIKHPETEVPDILEVPHPLSTKTGKLAVFLFMLGMMLLWGAL